MSVFVPWLLAAAIGALLAGLAQQIRLVRTRERWQAAARDAERGRDAEQEAARLRTAVAQLEAGREADAERLAWIHTADEQLRDRFRVAAQHALEQQSTHLDARAQARVAPLVDGVEQTLDALGHEVRAMEQARQQAYAGLHKEIALLRVAHDQLRDSAGGLAAALRSPNTRGRWGELQLRRVVEMAGMVARVDFEEQPTVDGRRPDMVVHLPAGGTVPVDAKAPLAAFLAAAEATDDSTRDRHLDAHAKAVRARITELAGKAYGKHLPDTADFVVLFLPNEAALASAFERDPALFDDALRQRVLPATPVSLVALLKTVAYGWQQQHVADNARTIASLGETLYARLGRFVAHLHETGAGLDKAVAAYNRTVGALEHRVAPAARRLRESGALLDEIESPAPIGRSPRTPREPRD